MTSDEQQPQDWPAEGPPPDRAVEAGVEGSLSRPGRGVDATITRREAGVRLRTNIQAGGASERVQVTAELHAGDMPELIDQLPPYRTVLGEQVEWSRRTAKQANETDAGDGG